MKETLMKPPSFRQRLTLRMMIVIGLVCMGFFINSLLNSNVVGYQPLYWLLISTFIYTFFKIVYEWYHYWSISIPATPPATKTYTVDIFTTFCAGEPYEMIIETLTAMKAITYPHECYLCDEADDPYLKSVCKDLGVHHVTRTVKIDAKAGNINNALKQSHGELCVILDPDHIPVPGFLDPVVSHFDNPEIGYVQVVQAYYNQDMSWIAKGAAQQTYQFYGPMMMCMNTYGTVQAIGANCTFRRSALESIGGHAAGLAEDMHTSMQLHAKKWKSIYVPMVLTKGLVPATLSAYYKQQLKWSRGVFELLVTSYISLFRKFSWRQKLHYGLLPFFYLSGFVFLINFLIPVIALATGRFPLLMDFSEFLIISIPFISAVVVIRHFVQQWVMEDDERGFHVVGGLLLIGTWWVFILGVIYTFIRKDVPYIATPKEAIKEKNLRYNLPNIFVLVVSLATIAYGLHNDWNPFSLFMAAIIGLNCLFMIFMLVASSELKMQGYVEQKDAALTVFKHIKEVKKQFWLLRRKVYSGVRRMSLLLVVLAVCVSVYLSKYAGKVYEGRMTSVGRLVRSEKIMDTIVRKKQEGALKPSYFESAKGVIYLKGVYWYKNIYPLTKKIISQDFSEIKETGANSLKLYGPNIYDDTMIGLAGGYGLDVYYSFWIPDPSYFVNNNAYLEDVSRQILKTVDKYKAEKIIKSWNLGNSTFQQLEQYYKGEQLNEARQNYLKWLKRLVRDLKSMDSSRSLTIDVALSKDMAKAVEKIQTELPEINAFGLVIKTKSALKSMPVDLKIPYFVSSAAPDIFKNSVFPSRGIFYASWQDQQSASNVTFDGLKDIWGNNKPYFYQVSTAWNGKVSAGEKLPSVKILRPALTTFSGTILPYRALVYLNNEWTLATAVSKDLKFKWYLVKTDDWGNPLALEAFADGPDAVLTIPGNTDHYRLYLNATKGKQSTSDYSTLNTPLTN